MNSPVSQEVGATSSHKITKEKFFQSIWDAGDKTSQLSIPTIQKVPFMLTGTKEYFKKHFVPRVVSIGPYHHGNEDLKQTEDLKLKFAGEFMAGNKKEVIMGVYDTILQDIDTLRKCYDEKEVKKITPSDEELAQVLFLDGCSVLHYIYCFVNDKLKDYMIRDHHVAFAHQDLFLLENQLPFRVLKLLINAKYGSSTATVNTSPPAGTPNPKVGMEMIEEFIQNKFQITPGHRGWQQRPDSTEEHSHLLDLLRKRLVGSQKSNNNGQLVKLNSFRNVSELTAAGINLKSSGTHFLTDVSFRSKFITGDLKLPPIRVDDSTGPMFLNLIAYEMSPGVKNNMEVTTYICFLDSLIDHSDDVKQLRDADILYNLLGSDEKVADLFNEISTDLVPNDQIYEQVKSDIQKHYNNNKKTAMAEFYHTHFSSPWTIIAFIWAFITILLTAITSFLTLFPSKDECNGLCKQLKTRYI